MSFMRYPIGKEVIYVGSVHKDMNNKKAVIIYINESSHFPQYLIEFYEPIGLGIDGEGRGKPHHCWWAAEYRVLTAEDLLDLELGGKPKRIISSSGILTYNPKEVVR